MSIDVSCPNGHSLKLKPAYAGRKIKCPSCREVIRVPKATTDSGTKSLPVAATILAICENGHRVKLKQKYAGSRVKCPECQTEINVPNKRAAVRSQESATLSTLAVICPNGHRLKLKAKYAGKRINCPSCKATIQVPEIDADTSNTVTPSLSRSQQTIVVTCSNNHELSLTAKHAGKKVKCPKCDVVVAVPRTPVQSSGKDKVAGIASLQQQNEAADLSSLEEESPGVSNDWWDDDSAPETNEDSWEEDAADSSLDEYNPDPVRQGKQSRKKTPKKTATTKTGPTSQNKLVSIIGGSVAAMLLIGGAIWWFGSDNAEPEAVVVNLPDDTSEPNPMSEVPESAIEPIKPSPPPILPPEPSRVLDRKLKDIVLAMHHHSDDHGVFAPSTDIGGKEKSSIALPLTKLSWRVHLLPYLNERPLYDQFHLDESWDSEHNLTLMDKMPSAFRIDPEDNSKTRFLTFAGPDMVFNNPDRANSIRDGMGETLAVFVTGIDKGVPWTRPDTFTILENDEDPIAAMGQLPGGLIHCALLDTKRLILPKHVPGHVFRALGTKSGNELVNVGNLRSQYLDFVQRAYSKPNSLASTAPTPDAKLNDVAQAPTIPSVGTDKTLGAATSYEFVKHIPPEPDLSQDVQIAIVRQKLQRLGIAFHTFSDVTGYLSPPLIDAPEAEGVSGSQRNAPTPTALSWRVHLLPYLGYAYLYSQFKLDEPWDSDHNSKLLDPMPEPFRLGDEVEPVTFFRSLTGANMMFGNTRAPVLREVKDGQDRTLIAGLAGKAIPWTCPDSLAPGSEDPVSFFKTYCGLLHGLMVDGKPVALDLATDTELLKAIATPRGQEQPDALALATMLEDKWSAALTEYREQASEKSPPVQQKLLKLGTALQLQYLQFGSYTPPRAKDEKSSEYFTRLSWRVHLLPFLGEGELYSKFKLDEPWNSPNNAKLLNDVPDVFRLDAAAQGYSHFQIVADENGLFPAEKTLQLSKTDGTNQTVMCIAVGPQQATPWTRPGGIGSTEADVRELITGLKGFAVNAVLADMSLISFPANASDKIKSFLTATGKDYVDGEVQKRFYGPYPQPLSPGQKELGASFRNFYQDQNNLSRVSSAMMMHHDVHLKLPVAPNSRYFDETGRPFLSWRVHLLPFLKLKPLYDRFKLDEPWDSENNKPLLDLMPGFYRLSDDDPTSNTTRMVRPIGDETANPGTGAISMRDIKDNKSFVIQIVTTGAQNAVPWTAPQDVEFDPQSPRSCLGKVTGPFMLSTASGGAFWVRGGLPSNLLKGMMTIAGREKMPPELKNFKR